MTHEENYKLAIEGSKTHIETYHFWMNMYAIINGALFVGLYNVVDKTKSDHITFGILILGCLAGWFWHLSVRGFHTWIISWVKNVQRFENDDGVYKVFCNVKVAKGKTINPLSLTKMFTLGVALVWSVLIIVQFYKMNKTFIDLLLTFLERNKDTVKFGASLCLIILLLIFILVSGLILCKEPDLRETNTVINFV